MFALPDDLRDLYLKFGVDLAKDNDDPAWTLPIPARFVLDTSGIIRAADADPDYTVRPEPSQTVAVLRALARGSQMSPE